MYRTSPVVYTTYKNYIYIYLSNIKYDLGLARVQLRASRDASRTGQRRPCALPSFTHIPCTVKRGGMQRHRPTWSGLGGHLPRGGESCSQCLLHHFCHDSAECCILDLCISATPEFSCSSFAPRVAMAHIHPDISSTVIGLWYAGNTRLG